MGATSPSAGDHDLVDERDLRIETVQLGPMAPAQAVRVIHLPTGLSAVGDGGRTPLDNKAEAIRLLRAKLAARAER